MKKNMLNFLKRIILLIFAGFTTFSVAETISIEKSFLYDKHSLKDSYSYKKTTRQFQWDKIKQRLATIESMQSTTTGWAVLQNNKNQNGRAPLVKNHKIDDYKRATDSFGVQQYQSIPLYSADNLTTPTRYGRDGELVRIINSAEGFIRVESVNYDGTWLVPSRYVNIIGSSNFNKVIFIDRTNQNITTLEKGNGNWLIRSMNPATTGLRRPPYQMSTPTGMFVIQQKKSQMIYNKDGSHEKGGFAPHASRFSNGGYIHGVPVNVPNTKIVEFSASLGTTPRSHMCVRTPSSHAKFIYDWAPVNGALVVVFD